ncbi:MAG: SH3 domain-containing protein [Desulfoprunum sp.]|jgi:hypothetical protein|uniref:SH3 domain-containing protein n=1 Tax=Desulfoprunum sp. TaxID=2020866 RepID=UPI00052E20EF|nr:hypothetical protein JT06_04010 [Desulfobulbus sp. Tol-SR]
MVSRISILILLSLLLFGCTATRDMKRQLAAMTTHNQELQEQNRKLTDELAEQKQTAARLQLEMVEKQVEIDKAWVVRKKIRDEVEFPRTRVMTAGSRAEAATCLAEVEIEANATSKASLTDEGKKKFSRVEELLEQSRAALDQERYDGACALAYQALALIDEIQFQSAPVRKAKASAYAEFLEPLQLRTVKKSNVRSRPSIYSAIMETLAAESTITAHGFRGNWVKVTTASEKTGWIYYPLLAVPSSGEEKVHP